MPYAIRPAADGLSLSWRAVREGTTLAPDEVLEERAPSRQAVWDSVNRGTREATEAELVELQKPLKKRQLADAANAVVEQIFPVAGQHASVARRRPNDPKVRQADDALDRLEVKLTAVDEATTIEQLDSVTWEEG